MRFLRKMNFWIIKFMVSNQRRTNLAKNQSRSQHSTLQFNFIVLNAIVKTLYLNFISESSTLNYVHQHSNQHCSRYMRFSRKMNFESLSWLLSYQGRTNPAINRSWDFNFRVECSTSNVTYQHTTLATNIGIDHRDNKIGPFFGKTVNFLGQHKQCWVVLRTISDKNGGLRTWGGRSGGGRRMTVGRK